MLLHGSELLFISRALTNTSAPGRLAYGRDICCTRRRQTETHGKEGTSACGTMTVTWLLWRHHSVRPPPQKHARGQNSGEIPSAMVRKRSKDAVAESNARGHLPIIRDTHLISRFAQFFGKKHDDALLTLFLYYLHIFYQAKVDNAIRLQRVVLAKIKNTALVFAVQPDNKTRMKPQKAVSTTVATQKRTGSRL